MKWLQDKTKETINFYCSECMAKNTKSFLPGYCSNCLAVEEVGDFAIEALLEKYPYISIFFNQETQNYESDFHQSSIYATHEGLFVSLQDGFYCWSITTPFEGIKEIIEGT